MMLGRVTRSAAFIMSNMLQILSHHCPVKHTYSILTSSGPQTARFATCYTAWSRVRALCSYNTWPTAQTVSTRGAQRQAIAQAYVQCVSVRATLMFGTSGSEKKRQGPMSPSSRAYFSCTLRFTLVPHMFGRPVCDPNSLILEVILSMSQRSADLVHWTGDAGSLRRWSCR